MPRAKVLQNNAEENTELAFFPFGGAVIRVLLIVKKISVRG